jgi:hypothetical protein
MSRIALALHIKTQLCQDIKTRGGIQAFRGSQGTSSQDLAYLLDKRITLYRKRGSKTRDKSTNLVKSWYKKNKDQYDLICQQFKVERFCPNSPNPRSTSKTTKRTASLCHHPRKAVNHHHHPHHHRRAVNHLHLFDKQKHELLP